MFLKGFSKRLGGRIFITFASVLLLLSILFGLFTTHFGSQLLVRSSANELRVLSSILKELIENQFSNLEGSLDDISSNHELLTQLTDKLPKRQWIEKYLLSAVDRNHQLTDLMIYDLNGFCVGSTDPEWYSIRGKSWRFFTQGLTEFNFPAIYGTESLGRVQLVSAPILDGDVRVGVIVAIVDLGSIYELMEQKIGLSETTDAFLLDNDLRFITAGRSGRKGLVESHLVSTALASHVKEENWVGEYLGLSGGKVLGTALKISGYSWYVVVERRYEDVLKQIGALNRVVVATVLSLIVVLIVLSFALSRAIIKPLMQLVQATRQIASGQYTSPVQVNDEFEEISYIATELERMRRKIAISQNRLKEKLSTSEQLRLEGERLAAIGSLAASLAHEIRNPLNAMALLLSRMQLSNSDDVKKISIKDLFGEISRLDRLVSSILDYARPVHLDLKDTDIGELIVNVFDMYLEVAKEKGVNLRIVSGPDLCVPMDQDGIKQCIVNLLKNAIEASFESGIVTLSWGLRESEFFLEVTDEGVGIPIENQKNLFHPFFSTKQSGTGLGLSSVKKIVAAHGGRVEMNSRSGNSGTNQGKSGCTFLLVLPST